MAVASAVRISRERKTLCVWEGGGGGGLFCSQIVVVIRTSIWLLCVTFYFYSFDPTRKKDAAPRRIGWKVSSVRVLITGYCS